MLVLVHYDIGKTPENVAQCGQINWHGHQHHTIFTTPYIRIGDYPILVLIFAIMISALYLSKKNER